MSLSSKTDNYFYFALLMIMLWKYFFVKLLATPRDATRQVSLFERCLHSVVTCPAHLTQP